MINIKKKGFIYKTLILTLATIFSYSVTNSIVVSNITGIDELGSIAFAKKEGKANKAEKQADKAAEHGDVVEVMDAIKEAGSHLRISIAAAKG